MMKEEIQIHVSPFPFSPKSVLPVTMDSGKKNVSSNGGICATISSSLVTFKAPCVTIFSVLVCLVITSFESSPLSSSFSSTSISSSSSSSSGCETINLPNRNGSSLCERLFTVLLVFDVDLFVLLT